MTNKHASKQGKKQSSVASDGAAAEGNKAPAGADPAIQQLLGVNLAPEEPLSSGVDVHQKSFHVALWANGRQLVLKDWAQGADPALLIRKLEPLRGHLTKIYYEAGPCGFTLARQLREAGFEVEVISPAHTPRGAVKQAKCDRLDAIALASDGAKGNLKAVYIPTAQQEQDRQVFRTREGRKRQLASVKQRIKAFLLFHGLRLEVGLSKAWSKAGLAELAKLELGTSLRWALDELLAELHEARAAVARCNQKLRQMAQSEQYRPLVKRLCTVPGVGLIVAMGFLLELMDLERFGSGRQLGHFVGLAPSTRSSGEKTTQEGRLGAGMSTLRSLLIEAAWRWRQSDPYARMQYDKLLANCALAQKAITALSRKLAIILWNLAKGELPYVPGLQRVPPAVARMGQAKAAKGGAKAG